MRRTLAAAGLLLTIAAVAGGCATRRFRLPDGHRAPSADAAATWDLATRGCRSVRAYSSTIRLSGRVGGDRIPPGLAVASGLTDAGQIRLEGRALGRSVFTLAGGPDRATLVLHRERQFVVDRADRILETLVGTPFGSERLLAVLTGCVSLARDVADAAAIGDLLEVVTGDARVYLKAAGAIWLPRLGFTSGVQIDYRQYAAGWPAFVSVWTEPGAAEPAALHLRIDQIQVNSFAVSDRMFEVEIPAGATEVGLDALRRSAFRGGG
jgi:hypothetical protein